jgi:hypothetical protein
VNNENPKPKAEARNAGAAPASKRDALRTDNVAGRVRHDDRGNAIWEWAIATGKFGVETSAQGLKKLDNPMLSLAEDAPTPLDVVQRNPLGTVKGYSPYDSGVLAKARTPAPRKKDLRKLSEWLKLKKQADGNKPDEE